MPGHHCLSNLVQDVRAAGLHSTAPTAALPRRHPHGLQLMLQYLPTTTELVHGMMTSHTHLLQTGDGTSTCSQMTAAAVAAAITSR
jgi:hypothetical protein